MPERGPPAAAASAPGSGPSGRSSRSSPDPAVTEERLDYFGNPVTYFSVQEPHRELVVTATHRIGVCGDRLPDPAHTPRGRRSATG